jgi:putative flippase GtrA
MMHSKVVILIPVYNPTSEFYALVKKLSKINILQIVIVDDGSQLSAQKTFQRISQLPLVTILPHAINLGKGAALKTGLNYAYCHFPQSIGVVTMDADGQHAPQDVVHVIERFSTHSNALVIGVRSFTTAIPFRSWLGNRVTKIIYRILIGGDLGDTQSGLRGIPRSLIPALLKIEGTGYEFELDMLVACKHNGRQVLQENIATIYADKNPTSHFNPLIDSLKIYFVLFRFMLTSLVTAGIDYSLFGYCFTHTHNLIESQATARFLSMIFNYILVRKLVFFSEQKHLETFPKYVLLVTVFGVLSYLLIQALADFLHLNVISAKIISELLMFYANFALQRDWIFSKKRLSQ